MTAIRVVIVDDHPLFRSGLRTLLEADGGTEVVGEAANGEDAVALVADTAPDVVLMDMDMPGLDGVEATRRVVDAHPQIGVLMLTMLEDPGSLDAALAAGARGYLVKGADGDEALRAIRAVADGQVIFSAAVSGHVLDRARGAEAEPFPELTDREREILRLMARGCTNAAIAERVYLTPKTVRNYTSSIFSKLGVHDRATAIVRAREAGLS